jgi:hypothetical protein
VTFVIISDISCPLTLIFSALIKVSVNRANEAGGDPEKVRASQKARFASEEAVDEVIRLDAEFKKGKKLFGVFSIHSDHC